MLDDKWRDGTEGLKNRRAPLIVHVMDLDLHEQRALVTAATDGIGLATVTELARLGAKVWLTGRRRETVDQALESVRGDHSDATVHAIVADAGTAAGCDDIIEALPAADILVNNLGVYDQAADFATLGDDDWERYFQVNVMSGIRLARHYLPGMLERDYGRIVFVASESAINVPPEMVHYGMTKAAQLAISRGIAERTAGTRVTCNAVLPGPTRSAAVNAELTDGQPEEDMLLPTALLRRLAEPAEVANMIAYVCSPASSATNGAALRVEGGCVRSIT